MSQNRHFAIFDRYLYLMFPVACIGAGDTISGASSGFVSSPNFPGNFLPSQQCIWIITVPSGRIKLSFLNFTLDHS